MTHQRFDASPPSRHVILRQLGHGNLTRVFLAATLTAARHGSAQGGPVVLKLLHPELAADDDFRALFLDQAATTLPLRHPNLVRTLEVLTDGDACGVALEFLHGQTLARVLERVGRQRFPVDLHLHVLSKVLDALEHAHAAAERGRGGAAELGQGSLHGDVCPSNVFITYDGEVKLLGAGYAGARSALEFRLGRPLVDVKYAAPELLLGTPAGASADLFGVGAMIWEAVARQARVKVDDAGAVIRRRTRGEEPDLESAWAEAPEPMLRLCSRALALDPRARHATARELRAELEAYLGRATESSGAVLARLPELMEATFSDEREQMQLFIGARLDGPEVGPPGFDDDDDLALDEPAPGAAPSARAPLDERPAFDPGHAGVARTGLRHARPDAAPRRATTGVHERGRVSAGAAPGAAPSTRAPSSARSGASRSDTWISAGVPPAPVPRPAEGSRWLTPISAASPGSAPSTRQASPGAVLEPPAPEATTAGHRAYSSSLDGPPRPRRSAWRVNADVLGATALLVGALVATYSVYRHAQRADQPESPARVALGSPPRAPASAPPVESTRAAGSTPPEPSALAVQAAPLVAGAGPAPRAAAPEDGRREPGGRAAAAPSARPRPSPTARVAAGAPPAEGSEPPAALEPLGRASGEADASAPAFALPPETSAFFDGQPPSNARHRAPPRLSADDLPAVDPELRSLQDEIVSAAKTKRRLKLRRDKKAELASSSRPASAPPRPIDDADPYLEPRAP